MATSKNSRNAAAPAKRKVANNKSKVKASGYIGKTVYGARNNNKNKGKTNSKSKLSTPLDWMKANSKKPASQSDKRWKRAMIVLTSIVVLLGGIVGIAGLAGVNLLPWMTDDSEAATAACKNRTFRKGSRSECVRIIQAALKLPQDAVFGSNTQKKVKDFQGNKNNKYNGKKLAKDGVVGKQTWEVLIAKNGGKRITKGTFKSKTVKQAAGAKEKTTVKKTTAKVKKWYFDYRIDSGLSLVKGTPQKIPNSFSTLGKCNQAIKNNTFGTSGKDPICKDVSVDHITKGHITQYSIYIHNYKQYKAAGSAKDKRACENNVKRTKSSYKSSQFKLIKNCYAK